VGNRKDIVGDDNISTHHSKPLTIDDPPRRPVQHNHVSSISGQAGNPANIRGGEPTIPGFPLNKRKRY